METSQTREWKSPKTEVELSEQIARISSMLIARAVRMKEKYPNSKNTDVDGYDPGAKVRGSLRVDSSDAVTGAMDMHIEEFGHSKKITRNEVTVGADPETGERDVVVVTGELGGYETSGRRDGRIIEVENGATEISNSGIGEFRSSDESKSSKTTAEKTSEAAEVLGAVRNNMVKLNEAAKVDQLKNWHD